MSIKLISSFVLFSYLCQQMRVIMKKLLNILLFAMMLTMSGVLFVGCSKDDSSNGNELEADNPLRIASEGINRDMAGFDFSELEPLGIAAKSKTRGDDEDSEINNMVAELVALIRGDADITMSEGRRFSYQAFNDALSLAFDLAGRIETSHESDVSFLNKHTTGHGEVCYTTSDGVTYTVAGTTEEELGIKSWSINVEKASELTIYEGDELLLCLKSYEERDRPVWLPLLIRGNTFTGELTYRNYIVTLGYDREHTHERSISLNYQNTESDIPLIDMTTMLTDDANILKLITHDVTVEADFIVKAWGGILTLTGHSTNVNYLVENGKAIAACLKTGTSDESSCQQLADEFNDNLVLKLTITDTELGNLFMGIQYDDSEGCWKPALMINIPQRGRDYKVADLLRSLGIDLSDVLYNLSEE